MPTADNWTELPHWTTTAWLAGEMIAMTHHPTRKLADKDARRMRRVYPMAQSVLVEKTA